MALASPDIGDPGPSAPSTSLMKYDVFLSFYGADTRSSFTDHLNHALSRKGIVTFMDDHQRLERGQVIMDRVLQAVKQSMFAIVVLSENYAYSVWCLEELLSIMESKYKQGQTVVPVFYSIAPSDVRHQRGSIGAALKEHEATFSVDKVGRWREALTEVSNLSGWDTRNRHEAGLIEDIAEFVLNKLDIFPSNYDYPVGDIFNHLVGNIKLKVDQIISLSKIGSDDVCFVGIWGMGGVGKTTLARGVYDAVRGKFEASCFLSNIREVSQRDGLAYLQRMLLFNLGLVHDKHDSFERERVMRRFLCRKKVLIILDDVSDIYQLKNLAGSEDWFGRGSKIIMTTRDKHLLNAHGVSEIYEVGTLNRDESLELFCRKAFNKDEPEKGYLDLSNEIIEIAGGIPLGLIVLGSFLCGRTQDEWGDILNRLIRNHLPEDLLHVLRISYNELSEVEKMIFLDIACFFNGRTKFEVTNILEICGLDPVIGIQVLIEKSLLSSPQSNSRQVHDRLQKMRRDIFLPTFMYHKLLHEASQESLHMHNVLQEMGRRIVYEECPNDAVRRSRLWNIEDIDTVLNQNMGTDAVQSIVVDLRHPFKADWDPECFSKMRRLRLLDLSRVELANNLNRLPRPLKFLRWDCYALESLPPVDQLRKLESLELRSSNIKRLWDKTPELHKLTTIDLSYSDDLMETPDFGGTPGLKKLFFNYCDGLIRVHESVGQLKNLVELSLRYCTNLETLPNCLDMNNLEVLILGECLKLEKLPEFSKSMRRLYFLDVRNTKISEIPLSIINLENLKYLDLSACSELKSVPELPPNSIIRANKDPVLASALDLQLLIESRFSKHPSGAEDPIHLVFDSKGKEDMPPWFEQQEIRHSKDDSGEVVTITADIPSELASYDGECWGIAVCIILECPSEGAWRGFAVNWKFRDYPHTSDKKGGRPHRTHTNAPTQVDSTDKAIHSKETADDDDPLAKIFSFEQNQQDETECRVYKGFFPIDKDKCRRHPSGEGFQVDLTLSFPTTNTIGKVIIHSKETSFGDLEIVDGGWRLVCKKDLDASSEKIGHEAEIAEDILGDEFPSNFEHLVGDIQSKVDRITSLLKMGLNDTCFLGIWGESGIGKTTFARLVYDEIQSNFGAACFLDNVREDSERFGIVSLQNKLLSGLGFGEHDIDDSVEGAKIIRKFLGLKKVLIILDDVSERGQLENLAGNKEWFGPGSKIVITITDKTLLTLFGQFEEYEVKRLHPDESRKLLCLEAFKKDKLEQGYLKLSKEVIEYACDIPLVLKVLGSFLCEKDEREWTNAIGGLRQKSPIDQLRICYDGLDDKEYKRIFLDIACFFNMEAKFKVINILDLCGPESTVGNVGTKKRASDIVKDLIQKSMLHVTHPNSDLRQNGMEDHDMLGRIQNMRRDIFLPTYLYDWLLQEASKEYLYMHDLLKEMGRGIVIKESPTDTGGRGRLWSLDDIDDVLKENKGTENVHSIVLYEQQSFEADWHPDCFSNMQELRLLDLSKVHLSRDLKSLPSALKIMRWDYYALESLPPLDQLHELISLQLRNSKVTRLWDGTPELHKLRTIDLSNSDLVETPDFSETPNLEKLLLNYCEKLVGVHKSVRKLNKLVELSFRYCTNLETLPTRLDMHKLEVLILGECSNLEKLPKFSKNMRSLYFLDVRGTDITEIPRSIIRLENLKYLDLTFCSRLKSIHKLPPNLIVSASNCRLLEPASALRHLYASCAPKGPIHLFYDFQLLTRIPTWFERWEYCWGEDTDGPTSGEFVTIAVDIPSNVVTDSNEERWGIAVCVAFQFLSQAWLGFSINWKFEDKLHPKKTKINGTPAYYMHDCRVYIGFYPFEAKDCRQHASGEGSQLDLTLEFPATNIIKGLHDLKIMGCGWRLACKKDFYELSETTRAPSPPRLGFLNDLDSGESSNISIIEKRGKRKYQEIECSDYAAFYNCAMFRFQTTDFSRIVTFITVPWISYLQVKIHRFHRCLALGCNHISDRSLVF